MPGEALAPHQHHAARGRRIGKRHITNVIGARIGRMRHVLPRHRQLGHHGNAHARGHHLLDGLQRRALETLADAFRAGRKPRKFRADFEHMVAKAVAGAEQQHGLVLDRLGAQLLAGRHRMGARHGHEEGLVIQRRNRQPLIGERLGQNGRVKLAGAQHFQQAGGEVFLQHQRHLRAALDDVAHQLGQQIGRNGVDHPQPQRPGQRIFAALGDLFDRRRLLDDALRLLDDFRADGRDAHLIAAALEQTHIKFFLELFDGDRQSGLADETGLGSPAKMPLASDGDDIA